MLLTIALVSDLAGGEGGIQCSLLSLVLRVFAVPSWALRLNSSAACIAFFFRLFCVCLRVINGASVHFAYSFSVFLRAQNSLITAMNVKCPKKTYRWVHLGRLPIFNETYRRKIIAYTEEHRSGSPPTDAWWIVT